jgi:Uma2 family endonuclease
MKTLTKRKSKLVLGPELAGTLMTPAEFDAVTEWDKDFSYELIHGVLIVSPIPAGSEVGPNEELARLLLNYLYDHPQGKALDDTLGERYVRTQDSRRKADRVIWAGLGRRPSEKEDPTTIVVEFVSKAKRDRLRDYEEKRDEYLAIPVEEYWIIDRYRRIMTVCRRRGKDLVVKDGETYRTKLLPGFQLDIARLFAVADRWDRDK